MNDPNLAPEPAAIKPGDIFYALFKHKVKIVLFTVIGIVVAPFVYKFYPEVYSSQSRLFIRYVEQAQTQISAGENANVRTVEQGDSIINSEMQIITSMDLASQIAEKIGPAVILNNPELAHEKNKAAKIINSGISVSVPRRSSIITVEFSNANSRLVRPVLKELIDLYLAKHLETRSSGSFDSFVNQQAEQYRARLARTDEELQNALRRAGVISFTGAQTDQDQKASRIKDALLSSNAELASRKATLSELQRLSTQRVEGNSPQETVDNFQVEEAIDPGVLQSYGSLQARLDVIKRREQDMLLQYTDENILVVAVRSQINALELEIEELEQTHPILTDSNSPFVPGERGKPIDFSSNIIQTYALEAKIAMLNSQYEQIVAETEQLRSVQTEIEELNRRKAIEEQNYRYFSQSREKAKIDEAFGAGRINNIGIVQQPTPAVEGSEKMKLRVSLGALLGCIAIPLAWALGFELFLDQSIKRPIDVKRSLKIPLFLSIPDTKSRAYRKLLKNTGQQNVLDREKRIKAKPSKSSYQPKSPTLVAAAKSQPDRFGAGAVANMEASSPANPWEVDHALHSYYEALRDRLIGFFEGRGMTHKPKLIGLTGIGVAPGTTTMAAGLAATLSETGEGNVLLVDMNLGSESAQQFYLGKNIADLDELLGGGPVTGKKNEAKLVVAAEGTNGLKLPKILPNRFNEIVPKLKTSEFDYIIFDMPAVSPISVTPRLASFMDAVFLVIESEKANKDVVARATELLLKTNENIGAILNKTKSYVPQRLQEEYLGDL